MPDDTNAHNQDSATSTMTETMTEHTADTIEGSDSNQTTEQAHPNSTHDDKQTAATSDDFASALETFTTESAEAVSDDHVLKGTVLKLTATHVVVDIGAKSEGMLPLAEVLDHDGTPRFKPGDEINVMRDKGRDRGRLYQPLPPESAAVARMGRNRKGL